MKSTGELIMDAVSSGAHDLTCAVSSVAHRVITDALWLVGDVPEGPPLSVPKLSRAEITAEMAAASKEAAGAMLRGACWCLSPPLIGFCLRRVRERRQRACCIIAAPHGRAPPLCGSKGVLVPCSNPPPSTCTAGAINIITAHDVDMLLLDAALFVLWETLQTSAGLVMFLLLPPALQDRCIQTLVMLLGKRHRHGVDSVHTSPERCAKPL